MNNINELKAQYKDIHPGFSSYLECMSRALLTGLSSFTLAFAGTYISQSLLKKHLPFGKKSYVVLSSLVAVAVSYRVTSIKTKACQAGWLAAEEKHTYFSEKSHEGQKALTTSNKLLKDEFVNNDSSTDIKELVSEGDEPSIQYEELAKRYFSSPEAGHQVIVVQPFVKWGAKKSTRTTPDLQLAEAVSLVNSLHKWKVIDKIKVPLQSLEKKVLFGSGALQALKEKIRSNEHITAVFISMELLKGYQHRELEEAFGVPVYDRYTIVMQIFKERAVTKEAKLQVSMAEIPYLWSKIRNMHEGESSRQGFGGPGESYVEIRRRILATREHKLKTALEKLRSQRELLRSKRRKHDYPTVAVVGYTNAGKTSLIKALTGEEALQPKDQLFATLDVTTHAGILPSKVKVLYVDTVGFMSDIPTNLIESFNATLEDALLADLIIHVCDISHPDLYAQSKQVTETLVNLNISSKLKSNILIVGNKLDLVKGKEKILPIEEDAILVSALTEDGLGVLKEKIEEYLFKATGRKKIVFRVPMGGKESSWLYKEAAVTSVRACPENSQYLLMSVVITSTCLNKFRHTFVQQS